MPMHKMDGFGACVLLAAALLPIGCGPTAQELAAEKFGLDPSLTLDLGDGVQLEAVLIPPGTFTMGGHADTASRRAVEQGLPHPHPPHDVTVTEPFYMGRFEVTNRQFERFLTETGYSRKTERLVQQAADVRRHVRPLQMRAGKWADDEQPVVNITWETAKAFCKWLSARSGRDVRLPTEAQWEYACRAGTTGKYYFGLLLDRPFHECARPKLEPPLPPWPGRRFGAYRSIPAAQVGRHRPNPWGLHDMLSNVREYCSDWFGPLENIPQVDPTGPAAAPSSGRPSPVIRGGTANQSILPCYVRSYQLRPGYDKYTGFRVRIALRRPTQPRPQMASPPPATVIEPPPPVLQPAVDLERLESDDSP
jgi:formylglycine-generating enzyme required for sulfatase activity